MVLLIVIPFPISCCGLLGGVICSFIVDHVMLGSLHYVCFGLLNCFRLRPLHYFQFTKLLFYFE